MLPLVRDRGSLARPPFQEAFDAAIALAYVAWVCARLDGSTSITGELGPVVTLSGL